MQETPLRLLSDVYWSFSEPVPNSLEDFIVAVDEYASSIEGVSPNGLLRETTPYREVDINYEYWTQHESGEWEAIPITVHLQKGAGPLTNGELLWKVHLACHPHLHDQDHHYFEGFHLVGESAEGVPVFEIVLGS